MAVIDQRTPPRVALPPPPRFALSGENVGLVDPPGSTVVRAGPATIQDVLNAIQDLNKKITQISKNQQILETKLSHTQTSLEAIETNLISAANWLYIAIWYYTYPGGQGPPGTAPQNPHWVGGGAHVNTGVYPT